MNKVPEQCPQRRGAQAERYAALETNGIPVGRAALLIVGGVTHG
jgi:hypothetical protein